MFGIAFKVVNVPQKVVLYESVVNAKIKLERKYLVGNIHILAFKRTELTQLRLNGGSNVGHENGRELQVFDGPFGK